MRPQSRRWSLFGIVLALCGGAIVAAVMAADVGGTPALEALAFRLGLALAPLLLAIGLSLAMTGVWLVWRARHPSERKSPE